MRSPFQTPYTSSDFREKIETNLATTTRHSRPPDTTYQGEGFRLRAGESSRIFCKQELLPSGSLSRRMRAWPGSLGLLQMVPRGSDNNRVIGSRSLSLPRPMFLSRPIPTTVFDSCRSFKRPGRRQIWSPPVPRLGPLTSAAANCRAVPCRNNGGVAETGFGDFHTAPTTIKAPHHPQQRVWVEKKTP